MVGSRPRSYARTPDAPRAHHGRYSAHVVLGVDASRANGPRAGVGRTVEHLLTAWSRQDLPFEQVRVFTRAPLDDLEMGGRVSQEVLTGRGPRTWWQLAHLRRKASQVDVFLGFYVLPLGHRGRSVVANLGVYEGSFAIPGWLARFRSRHYRHSALHADAVVVCSESVKWDLVRFYGIRPEKIRVVPLAADDGRFRPARPDEADLIERTVEEVLGEATDYFVFVGRLSQRRNVPALLQAFDEVAASRPHLRLLLVGSRGELDLERLVAGLHTPSSVRHINYLDQDKLALLYRRARALVMPTTREGFSIPILEAMQSGCPVLQLKGASLGVLDFINEKTSVGAEEAVLQVPDSSPQSLAHGLARLADDEDLRERLAERGLRCAAAFPSWDEVAGDVMSVLGEVAAR